MKTDLKRAEAQYNYTMQLPFRNKIKSGPSDIGGRTAPLSERMSCKEITYPDRTGTLYHDVALSQQFKNPAKR